MNATKKKKEVPVSVSDVDKPTPKERWRSDAAIRKARLAKACEIGGNRHLLEQSRILRNIIDPDVLRDEPEHAETRWAAYGYVNAFEATEDFTRLYVRYYERYRAKYIDQDPHPCPVDPEFASNDPGTMSALFSARQFADRLGIPYDRFIIGMFERLMTVGRYRRVPLPEHLFPPRKPRKRKGRKVIKTKGGVPVVHKALRHALKVQEEGLPKCDILGHDWDPRFSANNYRGDPAQERAIQLLASHPILDVFTPHQILANRLRKGRISADNARRVFPDAVVEGALDRVGTLPDISEPDPGLAPYRPHCLGLIQVENPSSACADCPWQPKCHQLAVAAEQQQMALTGYPNRKGRERIDARDRKRNERARKRTATPNGGATDSEE